MSFIVDQPPKYSRHTQWKYKKSSMPGKPNNRLLKRCLIESLRHYCVVALLLLLLFYTSKGCDEPSRRKTKKREEAISFQAERNLNRPWCFDFYVLHHSYEKNPFLWRSLRRQFKTCRAQNYFKDNHKQTNGRYSIHMYHEWNEFWP